MAAPFPDDNARDPRPAAAAFARQCPPAAGAAAGPRAPALGARRGPHPAARHLLPAAAGGHAALVDQREHHRATTSRRSRPGTGSAPTCRASTSSPSSYTAARWRSRSALPSPSSSIAIGGTLGVVAAYFGGWVDAVISRLLDILIAFPALVLALVIAEGLGPSEFARDRGAVGVRHPGVRADLAGRHADDPGAALHDRRAAVRHPCLADHRHATSCRTSCPAS